MKKNVSWLVVMVLLISMLCVSVSLSETSAEDRFTLRNGIMFGDSISVVESKETTLQQVTKKTSLLEYKGEILGNPDSYCEISFTDGKMSELSYIIFGNSRDHASEVYNKTYTSLVNKYGAPIGNSYGETEDFIGFALKTAFEEYEKYNDSIYKTVIDNYDEWVIKDGENYVKIELVRYSQKIVSSWSGMVFLSYSSFTEGEQSETKTPIMDEI